MAITLSAKGPNDVIRYSWTPAWADGDSVASYTLTPTGCVIASDENTGTEVAFFVSGGTAGQTASIAASAITTDGETLTETLYLPIYGPAALLSPTASDVCSFALRKVVGVGEVAEADEQEDALERLNDMLLAWKASGATVGVTFPLLAATELLIPDEYVQAIKYNLRIACHEQYGEPVTAYDVAMARNGLALVKNANLPDDRTPAAYF